MEGLPIFNRPDVVPSITPRPPEFRPKTPEKPRVVVVEKPASPTFGPLLVKKLNPRAELPFRAHPDDAGWDLTAISTDIPEPFLFRYETGLAVQIPKGFVGLLKERSSVKETGLVLVGGVIDSGYTGPISVNFQKVNPKLPAYRVGDRVAQLVIVPIYLATGIQEVTELPETDRGDKGFGSSGLMKYEIQNRNRLPQRRS